ncbi:MAG: ribonuclease P protein component [Acidimicrobiia bacterium]
MRDRATFAALSRARARREGPVTLRYVTGSDLAHPRVAFAASRATGSAVARNRVRRRLRAAVAAHRAELNPGAAYLFTADREAIAAPFDTLTTAVGQLVRSVKEAA